MSQIQRLVSEARYIEEFKKTVSLTASDILALNRTLD